METSKNTQTYKKNVLIDIIVNGYFYKQLRYTWYTLFPIDLEDVKETILSKLPSLKNRNDWSMSFSNQKVAEYRY